MRVVEGQVDQEIAFVACRLARVARKAPSPDSPLYIVCIGSAWIVDSWAADVGRGVCTVLQGRYSKGSLLSI